MASIPTGRVIERLDYYLDRNDFASAERHLLYWLSEASAISDDRGAFAVLNELVGFYRKTGKKTQAYETVDRLLSLIESAEMDGSVSSATAYINAATAYKSFGDAESALPLYEEAKKIYEANLSQSDGRLGGLYNNMALALSDLGRFHDAERLFFEAVDVMKKVEGGELEEAITYLNLAELYEREYGFSDAETKISECLDTAEALLSEKTLKKDGYFAFVTEKCYPTFDYYGRFAFAAKLKREAEAIREELKGEGT